MERLHTSRVVCPPGPVRLSAASRHPATCTNGFVRRVRAVGKALCCLVRVVLSESRMVYPGSHGYEILVGQDLVCLRARVVRPAARAASVPRAGRQGHDDGQGHRSQSSIERRS